MERQGFNQYGNLCQPDGSPCANFEVELTVTTATPQSKMTGRPPAKRRRLSEDASLASLALWPPSSLISRRAPILREVAASCPFWASQDLRAHSSCVNALSLSNDASCLTSGGDDLRVLLWDVSQLDATLEQRPYPKATLRGSAANIFAIEFSQSDEKLFSSGSLGHKTQMHHLDAGENPSLCFGGGEAGSLSRIRAVRC